MGTRLLRRLVLSLFVVVLGCAGVAGAGALVWRHYVNQVDELNLLGDAGRDTTATRGPRVPREVGGVTTTGGGKPRTGPLNILLVGIDERRDNPDLGARADSIIIAHIPATRDRAYLISLPRDTRVAIPAHRKSGFAGGTDKLNAAFAFGYAHGGRAAGFELLALTVRQLTGLSFDAGTVVNFAGLRDVVDAVGGVDLCVDVETTSVHVGWDAKGRPAAPYRLVPPDYHPVPIPGIRAQVYHAGCQHLTGWQALDYARQRELLPDGDYGRQRHQQQLIAALAREFTSAGMLANPLAANRALAAAGNAITFDGHGASLTDWILTLRRVNTDAITVLRTNGGQFKTQIIDGRAFELLDDTTRELFTAAAADRLDRYVAAHPERVSARP